MRRHHGRSFWQSGDHNPLTAHGHKNVPVSGIDGNGVYTAAFHLDVGNKCVSCRINDTDRSRAGGRGLGSASSAVSEVIPV